MPGHGNSATAVDHADDDGGGAVSFQRGVNGQGEVARTPPCQDPPEQWGEAETYVQLGLAGTGPVAAVVQPLPEILAQVVPSAPGECGGHGVLAGAAGQNGPADPQNQTGQPWEGAWDTSNTWFRDCYQDAGIPCAFQVFRPISALTYPCHPPPPELMTAGWWRYPRCWPGTRSARQPDGGRWLGITRAAGGRGSPSLPWEARPIPCQMMEYPQCRRP